MERNRSSVESTKRLSQELYNCIVSRNITKATFLVNDLDREQRMAVARQPYRAGRTLLYAAVTTCSIEPVRFVLEQLHADVNQVSGTGPESTTPLCSAVYLRFDDAVSFLLDHGADVNAAGPDQRTLVLASSTHAIDPYFVRYLVTKGADIHPPDVYGQTCLMRSMICWKYKFSHLNYLIEQGASVNAVDNLGDPALHYALRSRCYIPGSISDEMQVIRLLLQHGTDTSIRNRSGDDALQTAALHGSPGIIDYLIDTLKPTPSRCADLYSLVAARYVDELYHFQGATNMWKKSVSIRAETPQDEPVAGPNPLYNGAVEARDVQSLEAIADDRDALYMQALICRERILGSGHQETVRWRSKRALHYAQGSAYERGVELYKYAAESFSVASVHPVCQWLDMIEPHERFYKLFWTRYCEDEISVRFRDVSHVLKVLVEVSKCRSELSREMRRCKNHILPLSITVLRLLCRLKSSVEESRTLRQLIRELVQSKCETLEGQNVLHLAVHSNVSKCEDEMYLEAVEELLNAGVDVNHVDREGNTPLHRAVFYPPKASSQTGSWSLIIDLLLSYGAHVDIPNDCEQTAAGRLPSTVNKMQYMRLQCLAACAIRQHEVAYRNILPTSLVKFVDLH